MISQGVHVDPASFRDPSGFVFFRDGLPYRQVQRCYEPHYRHLMGSGLYRCLVEAGWLLPHTEENPALAASEGACAVLRPDCLDFVSYPYEWCFGQLRDAALLTIEIQQRAMQYGMTLKDATPFNIQFHRGRPVLIDTLSFEIEQSGQFWKPYRQFCELFLAPLALARFCDPDAVRWLALHPEGLPLTLVSRLLPCQARWRPSLAMHIVLHGQAQRFTAARSLNVRQRSAPRHAVAGLIESLRRAVLRLAWTPPRGGWASYDPSPQYTARAWNHKGRLVEEFLDQIRPRVVWDLGANTGHFSRLAAARSGFTLALDSDPGATERGYRAVRDAGLRNLLPLVADVTNPPPGVGWANRERRSLLDRGPADLVMALALVHHLVIGHNVPFSHLFELFAGLTRDLIVEFVPRDDIQARRLLESRDDPYDSYTRENFEASAAPHFETLVRQPLDDSPRVLYLMRNRRGRP